MRRAFCCLVLLLTVTGCRSSSGASERSPSAVPAGVLSPKVLTADVLAELDKPMPPKTANGYSYPASTVRASSVILRELIAGFPDKDNAGFSRAEADQVRGAWASADQRTAIVRMDTTDKTAAEHACGVAVWPLPTTQATVIDMQHRVLASCADR